MKKELEGILGREGTQPCVTTEDGKTRLIYNLFDGFTGKKVKFTIEEMAEEGETEEEMGWEEVEEEAKGLEESEGTEEEHEETEIEEAEEEEKTTD